MYGVFSPVNRKVACDQCRIADMCPLQDQDLVRREDRSRILSRSRALRRGQSLFGVGDCFLSLYVVQSGSIKVCVPMEEGTEQVFGFYFPGELVGLDGVGTECHSCTAVALEHTSVCELSFEFLATLTHSLPAFPGHLFRPIGLEMANYRAMIMSLSRKNAEQRLASFLLSYSMRCEKRGFSPHEFNLSMSRSDIANYLGVSSETVCRLFARLHRDGVIRVKGRFVQLIDADRLRSLLGEATVGGGRGRAAPRQGARHPPDR